MTNLENTKSKIKECKFCDFVTTSNPQLVRHVMNLHDGEE